MSKARRGRKRRPGRREPSGRLSRRPVEAAKRAEMTEVEAMAVVIDARMRHTGLAAELAGRNEAGRPNAGTVHGVLCLQGLITLDQWHAAEWYLETRNAWLKAILARGAASAPDGPAHGAEDSDAYLDWCEAARSTWSAVLDCIQEASTASRFPVAAALDVVLCRGQAIDHLLLPLRTGLMAIHRRFLARRGR